MSAQPPQYPEPAGAAPRPGPDEAPQYPQAPAAPQYPGSTTPPPYPQQTTTPQYPDTATPAAPQYPGAATPPYPGSAGTAALTSPASPMTPGTPPKATPSYPVGNGSRGARIPAPAHRTPRSQAPVHPTPPLPAAPPPVPSGPPAFPQQPASPAPTAPGHPAQAVPSLPGHQLETDTGRRIIRADQRRTDTTAVGNLLIHLPHFVCSLGVMSLLSLATGLGVVLLALWLLSGLLIFHRPSERIFARQVLGLREPLPEERSRLAHIWDQVSRRAGVDTENYQLWVQESEDLNAVAAAGHIVGVTRFALRNLSDGELAAVLAHELGHHVGGHAWSSLLGHWYSLPARIAWRVMTFLTVVLFRVASVFSALAVVVLGLTVVLVAMATVATLYGLPLLILLAPYALAAVGRRAELRADLHAAELGFAPMLASVLHRLHQQDEAAKHAVLMRTGKPPAGPGALGKLLSSHPDHPTRLQHLQPFLQPAPLPATGGPDTDPPAVGG
ncbi:M48 family metalloprotease [Streptomyces sp. NPDC002640]